jgi:D-cysteine desulfhydrase
MLLIFATIQKMSSALASEYPELAKQLPMVQLADLPTAVTTTTLHRGGRELNVAVKHDDLTGKLYGGNKVRKLEYLLQHARTKNARRIATFGTVASNHALATSLYARSLGLECTCFLSNQVKTPSAARALQLHLQIGTDVVRYGGARRSRIAILRQHLRNRQAYLIPPGGSNWLGTMGFVNAGLELAAQIDNGETAMPERLYVANGTMATAVGIALGLALARLPTEVQAIQVTEDFVSSPAAMQRLLAKTTAMMRRLDASIPADLTQRANYRFRTGFLGDGYAKTNEVTDRAIAFARDELGIALEATYTGKAMAALLQDLENSTGPVADVLFWNTYNSRPLAIDNERPPDLSRLPKEFLRYLD